MRVADAEAVRRGLHGARTNDGAVLPSLREGGVFLLLI